MKMQFREGTEILTADGEKVGEVSRLVVDPKTQEISHIVIEKGFIFKESRVMPLAWVKEATSEAVRLRDDIGDVEDLPRFEQTYFVPEVPPQEEDEEAHLLPLYWYPPYGVAGWGATGGMGAGLTLPYVVRTERNIPEGSVVLDEGMKVMDKFDEHVGNVARVFFDDAGARVTHILISQGFLLTKEKLVPVHWIARVTSETIHLAVSAALIESLPEYETSA